MPVYAMSGDEGEATLSTELGSQPSQPHRAHDSEQFSRLEPESASVETDDRTRAMESWRERASAEASKAHATAERNKSSPTAFARLAVAQRAAGENDGAVEAARRALLLISRAATRGGPDNVDIGAAMTAARVLANAGESEAAASILNDLPDIPILRRVLAGIAADGKDYKLALGILGGDSSAYADSIRGYLLLLLGEPQQSIQPLKHAWREISSADDAINLAIAFWSLKSPRIAVQFARQASRVAPGRLDISFTLLNFLLASGDAEAAKREVGRIKSKKYIEPPEFVFFQARVEIELGRNSRARSLMREALELARSKGNDGLAAEIEGNIAYLEFRLGELSKSETLRRLERCAGRSRRSIALLEIYSRVADRVEDAYFIERRMEELREVWSDERLLEVRTSLSFLQCDFQRTLDLSEQWMVHEPTNPRPVAVYLMIAGPLLERWEKSTATALGALRRFGGRARAINNVAYVLALAGCLEKAEHALSISEFDNFYTKATEGLVNFARGKVGAGLRLYREAADLADSTADGAARRALMTLHEGMAIRHFGLLQDVTRRNEVIAGSLPPVELPADWRSRPDFVLMERIAAARGWSWPMSIS
jgi:tetratricopeptide (TPR) repeat protein